MKNKQVKSSSRNVSLKVSKESRANSTQDLLQELKNFNLKRLKKTDNTVAKQQVSKGSPEMNMIHKAIEARRQKVADSEDEMEKTQETNDDNEWLDDTTEEENNWTMN